MKEIIQLLVLSVILVLFSAFTYGSPNKSTPLAVNGTLDLRTWDFENDGPIALAGEWEFYWKEFLIPNQRKDTISEHPVNLIKLPGAWKGYQLDGEEIADKGFATYRLKILLDKSDVRLALMFGEIRSAFTAYVNGKEISSVGTVGDSLETSHPKFFPHSVRIDSSQGILDIALHVSNFRYRTSGATVAILLGTERDIHKSWEMAIAFDFFLFGSLIIMGLYHLGLYFNRKSDKSPLYFGLFCLLVSIRIPILGNYFLMHLFPNFPFDLIVSLDFISFYLAVPVFLLFVRSLFPDQSNQIVSRLVLALGLIYTCSIIFFPITIFTRFTLSYQAITVIVGIHIIYVLLVAAKYKKEGSVTFLLGFFIFFVTTINDFLYGIDVLKIGIMVPIGLLIFIFFQAYLLTVRFSHAFSAVESLTGELQIKSDLLNDTNQTLTILNEKLEKKVEERTSELNNVIHQLELSIQTSNELAEKAQSANIAKSNFLANMSHEIRTPMNGIIGMTDLLLETELDKNQIDFTMTVQSSAESLLIVINDILDFSKIEAGKLEFETINFDLRTAVEDVSELLAVKAEEKGLELIYMVNFDVPANLQGDPGRLKQVLFNLCGNAIKFTEKGEVIIKVSLVKEDSTQATLCFEIIDSGIGISAENQKQLFKSFTQVDASVTRKYGGTGLGLAISKQLVKMMGGTIEIESELDKGSTFRFLALFEKQPMRPETSTEPPNDIEGTKILVVDDIKLNRQLLREYLNSWHCRFDETESGLQALEKLKKAHADGAPFKIAILDMQMPDMDGETLGEKIKADPTLKNTILIMLTSSGAKGDASRASKIGFSAYLTKPIKQSQLFDCLVAVLGLPVPDSQNIGRQQLVTRYSLAETKKQREHILLAEDNKVNQKLALKVLEKMGYRVDMVENGNEAIQALEKIAYDVVLMDLQMPGMGGLEATAIIRDPSSKVLNHQIPIIAMTAHAMVGDKKKCLDAGMSGYVSKPIKKEILFAEIEKQSQ